jgi:hypothetical protein
MSVAEGAEVLVRMAYDVITPSLGTVYPVPDAVAISNPPQFPQPVAAYDPALCPIVIAPDALLAAAITKTIAASGASFFKGSPFFGEGSGSASGT